jgi:RecA-family ATPase
MKTLTLDQYADLPTEEGSYLIDRFIPCPGRVLLVGPPKEGKSYLGLQIGLAVAKGEPFMGRPSKASKVLYLQYDTPHMLWLDRVKQLRKAGVKFHDNFVMLDPMEAKSSIDVRKSPKDIEYLSSVVETVKPKLVIIDTLRKCFSGDENSSDIGAEVFNTLNVIFKDQAVVYIHHTHKLSPPPGQKIQARIKPVDAVRGTSFFAGEVDAVYLLYASKLSTDVRFDESTDYPVKRDPDTKLWVFPEAEKLLKLEANIRSVWASKQWPSWDSFRKHLSHTFVSTPIPDHLIQRLEGELLPLSAPVEGHDLPQL